MKHCLEQKVYYSDTDAYAVTWHGAYLRWMEAGRIEFCEKMGHTLVELQEQDIVLPVSSINIKYKAPAKLNDTVIVETEVKNFTPLYVTFEQKIINKNTKKLYVEATVNVVAVNNEGKLYRRMPRILLDIFKQTQESESL
ncbi:MAG: acyl-CoA thioesterase [bacterium]|nr:acyl-CoA thioesterase [bacterium]